MASAESVFLGLAKEQFGLILGIGVGEALAAALEPQAVAIRQAEYNADPNVAVDPATAALIVAEAVELRDWGAAQAQQFGINGDKFDAIIGEVLNAPDVSMLYSLWRRGLIDQAGFVHGLRKAKLEGRWDDALLAAKEVLLSSEELANAQQQQFIDEARANEEAALQGVTAERQQIRFKLSGLPPGVETALQMLRRKIIDQPTFRQIVAEGHTKTKYTDDLLALEHPVLSATEYAELHLRQWITAPEMDSGGALTGYTPEQMQLLYENRGRPATGHQILIGLRRGGVVGGSLAGIPQAFVDAIARSNIRPEYTNPLWHAATSYPSGFMIRGATQAGDITPTQAHDLLFESGWNEKWIDVFVNSWAGGAGAAGKELTKAELLTEFEGGYITENELRDHLAALGYSGPALDLEVHLGDARRIRGWRDKAITALGKRYVASTMDAAAADGYLVEIGVPDAGTRANIIRIWDIEREFK